MIDFSQYKCVCDANAIFDETTKKCIEKVKDPCDCGLGTCNYEFLTGDFLSCKCNDNHIIGSDGKCWSDVPIAPPLVSHGTTLNTPVVTSSTVSPTVSPIPSPPMANIFPLPPQPGECWYSGTRSHTKSGHQCERWDSNEIHYTEKIIKNLFNAFKQPIDHNYCRNPTGDESGPWCYTMEKEIIWEPCNIDQITYCADPENYVEIDQHTLEVSPLFTIMPEIGSGGSGGSEGTQCTPPDECGHGCAEYDFLGVMKGCKCDTGAVLESGTCVIKTVPPNCEEGFTLVRNECKPSPSSNSNDKISNSIDDDMPKCTPPDDCEYGCANYDMFGTRTSCNCIANSNLSPTGICLKPQSTDIEMPDCFPADDCGYGCAKYDIFGTKESCICIENSNLSPSGECLKSVAQSDDIQMPDCFPADDCGYGCAKYDMFGSKESCICMENSKVSPNGECLKPVSEEDQIQMPECVPADDCGYGCAKYSMFGSKESCTCIENSKKSKDGNCLKPPYSKNTKTFKETVTQAPIDAGYLIQHAVAHKSVNALYMEQHELYNDHALYKSKTAIPLFIYYSLGHWYIALDMMGGAGLYISDGAELESTVWTDLALPKNGKHEDLKITKWNKSCSQSEACGHGQCDYLNCENGFDFNPNEKNDKKCSLKCMCDEDAVYDPKMESCVKKTINTCQCGAGKCDDEECACQADATYDEHWNLCVLPQTETQAPIPKCTKSWFGTLTCTCDTGYKYEKETASCQNRQCDKDCGVKGHCEFDPSFAMLCICNPGVEIDFWTDKCE